MELDKFDDKELVFILSEVHKYFNEYQFVRGEQTEGWAKALGGLVIVYNHLAKKEKEKE